MPRQEGLPPSPKGSTSRCCQRAQWPAAPVCGPSHTSGRSRDFGLKDLLGTQLSRRPGRVSSLHSSGFESVCAWKMHHRRAPGTWPRAAQRHLGDIWWCLGFRWSQHMGVGLLRGGGTAGPRGYRALGERSSRAGRGLASFRAFLR